MTRVRHGNSSCRSFYFFSTIIQWLIFKHTNFSSTLNIWFIQDSEKEQLSQIVETWEVTGMIIIRRQNGEKIKPTLYYVSSLQFRKWTLSTSKENVQSQELWLLAAIDSLIYKSEANDRVGLMATLRLWGSLVWDTGWGILVII